MSSMIHAIRNALASLLLDGHSYPLSLDRTGSLEINASIKDWRFCPQLAVNTLPTALSPGPCDGIKVNTEGAELFCQPSERPLIVTDGGFADATKWTCGAGVAVTGGAATWTNAAADLTQVTTMIVGQPYLHIYQVTAFTAGGVTPYLGTAAGTKRTAIGVYSEVIVCAGSSTLKYTSDAGSTLSIDNSWLFGSTGHLAAGAWHAMSCSYIASAARVTTASGVTTVTLNTDVRIRTGFYRAQP
jgi:hypothetical protein